MGHPGQKTMSILHLHINGMAKLHQPPFFWCHTCMMDKLIKCTLPAQVRTGHEPSGAASLLLPQEQSHGIPGSRFHMDTVRGYKYGYKGEDDHLVTSLDSYNSYLLIIDWANWYLWVFLSKYKTPPITTIKTFLSTHGATNTPQKLIRTDEGGELWGSHAFQQTERDAEASIFFAS